MYKHITPHNYNYRLSMVFQTRVCFSASISSKGEKHPWVWNTIDNLFIVILPITLLVFTLTMARAPLVSDDSFVSQASSVIWKIITRKDHRKNTQNSDNYTFSL